MDEQKVSVVIPVIRPIKAQRVIAALESDLSFRDFEIVMEEDLERIGCPKMVKRLVEKTKYSWVMFLGDDTLPRPGIILKALEASKTLRDGWGLVGLNDEFNTSKLATHWMAHKNLLPLLGGEFFYTGYNHGYCDHELTKRCAEMGRYVWAVDARLEHDHPIVKGRPVRGDYLRVYTGETYLHDLILFRRRERSGWTSD